MFLPSITCANGATAVATAVGIALIKKRMMLYEAQNPTEYLELLEKDWRREKLLQLRTIIFAQAPNLIEGIHYKMLGYSDEKGVLFHLNAQKNYVSLYVGDAQKIDPTGALLQGMDVGKGCVRIKKKIALADTQIEAFISRAVELWRDGADLSC